MKQFTLLFLILSCWLPTLLFSQWRNITTTAYQQQVASHNLTDNLPKELSLPITLPLVFHIVYPKESKALKREIVEWQVAQLNKHFSLAEFEEKKELFKDDTYHHLAVDTEIRFCLNNVFFVASDSTKFVEFNSIKNSILDGISPLDTENYINIWVGELEKSSGYAQLPGGVKETDGIVIDVDYFGEQIVPYGEGKTLTHLMGNYLGLKDLWGNKNCEDDGVADTPIHNAPNYNKVKPEENHISLCAGFKREMYMNYMDNTVDSMLYMFTAGQKQRMHHFLSNERNHLLESVCEAPLVSVRSSVASLDLPMGLNVAPNPITDQLTIDYYDKANIRAVLEIHNALGKLMYTERIGMSYQESLSTQNWTAGIYVLTIKGTNNYSLKLIKQ